MPINQLIIYSTPEGNMKVEVFYKDETFWLTQKAMAKLFGVEVPAVNKHLKNIFSNGELLQNSVISKMETTATSVSMFEAKLKAESEFATFRVIQDREFESDFDKEIKRLNQIKE